METSSEQVAANIRAELAETEEDAKRRLAEAWGLNAASVSAKRMSGAVPVDGQRGANGCGMAGRAAVPADGGVGGMSDYRPRQGVSTR